MKRFLYILPLLLTAFSGKAQTISGSVQDANQQPAAYAIIKLLRLTDSTLVRGAVANQDGQYVLAAIPAGVYRIQASLIGMTTGISDAVTLNTGQSLTVEPLRLQTSTQILASITVHSRKAYIEQQIDKTVLNIAADATAQGKTAYELLQQAPGVMIDPNDNIKMAGKQGATVYLDGKPTNLSANDLANLLRATPATNIENVELIANPSARYDAQGGAGIINIRFRRDKSLGLNGNVSGGYGQSDHHRANAALDLNYRTRWLNLFGNVAVSDNFQITNVAVDRLTANQYFQQRGADHDGTQAIVYKTGIDYFVNAKQTLGLIVSGNHAANRFGTYTTTRIFNTQNQPDSSIANTVDNPSRNHRINAALNYRYTDTLGFELNLDADLTRFSNTAPNTLTSVYDALAGEPLFTRRSRQDGQTDITILTLKTDAVKEWKSKRLKLEMGMKHTDVNTTNDLQAYGGLSEQIDVSRTNRFTYREQVSAAYASLNRSAGKWSLQAGLRAEHSTIRGRSTDLLNQRIDRPDTIYLNLFPTTFIQYQMTNNSQFALNYGRRINRPNYQSLNPFTFPVDPYTSERGNPYLRPSFEQTLALSYTYKWASTLKISYGRTDGYTQEVIQQQGIMAYATVANVGRADALNLSFSTPYQFTKWWSSYVYAGATWNHFTGNITPSSSFDTRTFAFEGYMQHSFTLSTSWSAQVSGFWNAPTNQTIYHYRGLGALNLSVQKKILHDRGKLTIGIDDVFNTMRWRWSNSSIRQSDISWTSNPQLAEGQTQQFYIDRKWESRRLTIRFSYRLGSSDVKAARERETGQDAGRIKTKGNL